ncbi:MAG: helix-turn-helix domain-containing protein [Clostridia bacterium]|nr:helix-turn-helix domain-containing protein [Clostridia bacterium]
MSNNASYTSIGETIAKLRHERGIKQEELARAVQVSVQAVSKWENGGSPDIELLPAIADFFSLPIDALFGRECIDERSLEKAITDRITATPKEKQIDEAFKLCWVLEKSLYDRDDGSLTIDSIREQEEGRRVYSSINCDGGNSFMELTESLPYFFIAPRSSNSKAGWFEGIDYPALFADLANRTFFRAMVLIHTDTAAGKNFTSRLIAKKLGIEDTAAAEICEKLKKYRMIHASQLEIDDEMTEIYTINSTLSFPAMLTFARHIIDRPNRFYFCCTGMNRAYFDADVLEVLK